MAELGIQPNLWRCANTLILSALGTSCEMLAGGGVTEIGGNALTVLEDVFEEWPHTLSTWKTERQIYEQRWESGDVLFIQEDRTDDVSVCFVFVINETLMDKQTVTDHIKAMNEWIRQKIRDRVCVCLALPILCGSNVLISKVKPEISYMLGSSQQSPRGKQLNKQTK